MPKAKGGVTQVVRGLSRKKQKPQGADTPGEQEELGTAIKTFDPSGSSRGRAG